MATGFTAPTRALQRWLDRTTADDDRAAARSLPWFVAAGVLVVVISVSSLVSSDARRSVQRSMEATYANRGSLEQFIALMARAEASVRAVALTGDRFYVERYEQRRPQVLQLLTELERRCAADPVQLRRVQALQPLVLRQFAANDAVLHAWQAGGTPAGAQAMAAQPLGVTIEITQLIDDLRREFDRRLTAQIDATTAEECAMQIILVSGVLLSGFFAAIAIITVYRAHARVRASNRNLAVARDEAVRASQLKSQFVATISHEIRTPMNAIISMAGMLAESPLDAPQREMNQVMVRAGESLLTLIDDLLDLSKIEAGKLRLESKPVDLCRIAQDTLALLAPRAREKQLRLSFDCALSNDDLILADGLRLRQVLINLVGNAIKYTDTGGVGVTITGERDAAGGERVRVEVRDTGPGVPAAMISKLFLPFSQAEATAHRPGSTGLGLAVSRQLIELMGGRVGVESTIGSGSTFWFEIAFDRVRPDVATPPAPPPVPGKLRPLKLLVVEDNPDNQIVARIILRNLGHTVDLASSGEAALARLTGQHYDAVLMDCAMPGIDGYEATRRIRSGTIAGIDARVPVIGLTAYALSGDADKCRAAGMDEYLTKPIRLDRMTATLARCVRAAAPPPPPPVDEASADDPDFDPAIAAVARRLPGNAGPSLWPEMLAVFRRDEPARMAELTRVVVERDAAEAAHRAHLLAGSCAGIGAMRMRTLALLVETAVRAANWAEADQRLTELQGARARVRAALEQEGAIAYENPHG